MKAIKNLKQYFNYLYIFLLNYSTILLGLIMFSIFIYFKFIRTRIPKDIPYNVLPLGLFILFMLCCIYTYIIFRYFKPLKKSNEILTIIVDFIYLPLNHLDDYIKSFKRIKIYYPKVIKYICKNPYKVYFSYIFEIIFYLLPRIMLISVFIIDIFIFHKLYYIYYVIVPMGLLLFVRRYFIYTLNKLKSINLELVKVDIDTIDTKYEYGIHPSEWPENKEDDDDEDDYYDQAYMSLPPEIFINYYIKNKIYENKDTLIDYIALSNNFASYYQHTSTEIRNKYILLYGDNYYKARFKRREELKIILLDILNIYLLSERLNICSNNKYIKIIKLIINILYLICWSYLLIENISIFDIKELFRVLDITINSVTDSFNDEALNKEYFDNLKEKEC